MNEASSGGDGLHINSKVGIVMAVDKQANGLAGSQSGQATSTILIRSGHENNELQATGWRV